MLAVYTGLLFLVAVVIGVASLHWLSSPSQDRLSVIGNLLSLGTLLLALVAGIVAIAAYSAATGLPDLKLQFSIPFGRFNYVQFDESPVLSNGIISAVVQNKSSYAARTPSVIVEFWDAAVSPDMHSASAGWAPTARSMGGYILAFQWDGGPISIHGNSSRHLPDLNLQGLHFLGPESSPKIIFRLLADGYSRRDITLPIEWPSMRKDGSPGKAPPDWF